MTIRATASFRVKENELDTALDAIRTFVEHTRTEPGTLRYESWRSIDRPTEFLHVMEFADEAAEQAHGSSDAVRAFTDALYPKCEEPPGVRPVGERLTALVRPLVSDTPSCIATTPERHRANRRSGTNHINATATNRAYEIQGLTNASGTARA